MICIDIKNNMNTGILLTSFKYLRSFTSVVSLSKCIYKNLKLKLYSDFKFRSAITNEDLVTARYLAKYVIHRDIISGYTCCNMYEILCVFKKANLIIVQDPYILIDNAKTLGYHQLQDTINFILDNFDLDSKIIDYISDNIEDNNNNDTELIKNIISKTGATGIKIIYKYISRIVPHEIIRFICERNNLEEIDNMLWHISYSYKLPKFIEAINIVYEYTDTIDDNFIQSMLWHSNQDDNLLAITEKGFKINYSKNTLLTAFRCDDQLYIWKAFPNVTVKRSSILNEIYSAATVNTLVELGFIFDSDDDDAIVSFIKNNHSSLVTKIINELGVRVHKQSTLMLCLRQSYENYKALWQTSEISGEILLTAIKTGKFCIVKMLLNKGVYDSDMFAVAKQFGSKLMINAVNKYAKEI